MRRGKAENNVTHNEVNQSLVTNASTSHQQHACNNSYISLMNESSDVSIKCSAIQLFEKLVCSSSHVRNLLFDNMPYCEFQKDVTLVRRIIASILDDLQGFVIPSISKSSNFLCDGCNNHEKSQMEAILFLCINETRIVALMRVYVRLCFDANVNESEISRRRGF